MAKTNDVLSVTISGKRIVNASGNNLIDISASSISSKNWDCEFDEKGTLQCDIFLHEFWLNIELSQAGYMEIYVTSITLLKFDDLFLSTLQHLFYPFGEMKKTLWKGHILPKGAKVLKGTLKLYYNPEESRLSVCFSYSKQISMMNPNLGVSMNNIHSLDKSIDINLTRFGL